MHVEIAGVHVMGAPLPGITIRIVGLEWFHIKYLIGIRIDLYNYFGIRLEWH